MSRYPIRPHVTHADSTPQTQAAQLSADGLAATHQLSFDLCWRKGVDCLCMSVKATIDGELWEFSTASEAAEFKRSLMPQVTPPAQTRQPKRRFRVPSTRTSPRSSNGPGRLSTGSQQILKAIQVAPDGLQSEAFAQAIGSPGPRSVPPRMMILGKELKALGMKPGDVVIRSRIYVKGRARSVFKPGPRLAEVLQ